MYTCHDLKSFPPPPPPNCSIGCHSRFLFLVFILLRPQNTLRHNSINPGLLQLLHLSLEALHLLPAVQRPTVILPQAADDLAARLFHTLRQLAHLLALLESAAELLDLLADRMRAESILGVLVLCRRGQLLVRLG